MTSRAVAQLGKEVYVYYYVVQWLTTYGRD